ncbi:alpha-keto acid decarboxylase family protein [Clostridium paridis]|uniref:Alpha-keto-acid decarboxylase n=1 Tax=Clostridium paridis TaxID=2803863 RepID=A0A937FI83_9CLOT|nr:thiamine pyrophosphate-dependent enzyme [Clostridium paridis]MBL4931911.1 alpha-keto acid decarboxylase family protein [Clostridium paridis]
MSDNTTNTLDLKQTVGFFLFDCLKKEGITEIFGVPGDYNFSLLNILEKYQYIDFINCRNELNAGYATDSYARIKGMGALITTFGVGELSACNAIAGSYCESVPVIHIVGAPKTMVQQEHKQMHHTLLNGDFDVFRKLSENITEYNAVITPENATLEIPLAIQKAKENKKPVYLLFATDIVSKNVVKRPINLEVKRTNQKNLQTAIKQIEQMLTVAKNPLLISGTFVSRYNLQSQVEQIVQKMNLPVTTMIMGKGSYDESNKNYIGLYAGGLGSKDVQNIVETSDCILSVGTKWSDYNTGAFTAMLNPLNIIDIQPYYVKVGVTVYENILIKDLLDGLLSKVDIKVSSLPTASFPYTENHASLGDDISSKYYYPRFQSMFKENDVIVADAGTFQFGIAELRLPKGATYITQGGWGSIGYGTPAAFGACIADRNRRVILFVGDGSNQMTVQEFSSILYTNCKPIVFLVNNKEYTIEKYLNINEKQTHYNDIPIWDYSKLIDAFGGNAYTAKVYTNKELDEAIKQAELQCQDRFCFIEIYAPQMDAPEIVHKMTNVLEQMKS